MLPTKVSSPLAYLLAVLVALPLLNAREKFDLERVTPVPANEPVPTMDFFRPTLLATPRSNRAGTHVAALFTRTQDRRDLLIYNLGDKTFRTLSGQGEKDIYSFRWLDDTRLLYLVSSDKIYALAMM